jgi:hypothetical protein
LKPWSGSDGHTLPSWNIDTTVVHYAIYQYGSQLGQRRRAPIALVMRNSVPLSPANILPRFRRATLNIGAAANARAIIG